MKLLFLASLAFASVYGGSMDKCEHIPKGGQRRYTKPRTIQSGNNNPAAITFLIDNRAALLGVFQRGSNANLASDVASLMPELNTFSEAVEDAYMGQIFREARQGLGKYIRDAQAAYDKADDPRKLTFRDNSQRVMRQIRDITYSKTLLDLALEGTDAIAFKEAAVAFAAKDTSEGAKVYQNFVATKMEQFIPDIFATAEVFEELNNAVATHLLKVLQDEKVKSKYRQLVNELPLVYQFFNDNIEYIELNNVDKSLEEAIAIDIMTTLAQQAGDTQVESMIKRNVKFIKKLMTQRAQQQQKEKAVGKVMDKTKELREAAENEAEFNRILAEKKQQGIEVTAEMEKQIWQDVKAATKAKQGEEIGNQMENKDNSKKQPSLSRYQHLVGIMGLMPDELQETIAEMVHDSCPDLDLLEIDTEAMKKVVEAQPENFIDQLLKELHDVCDMFGLIDESKVTRRVVNGVEVEIYAYDWMDGEKKVWKEEGEE